MSDFYFPSNYAISIRPALEHEAPGYTLEIYDVLERNYGVGVKHFGLRALINVELTFDDPTNITLKEIIEQLENITSSPHKE